MVDDEGNKTLVLLKTNEQLPGNLVANSSLSLG
jgi:hypothetical protein